METTKQIIDDIESGKLKVIGKWQFIFNFWTPIVSIVVFLVGAILWYANAEGRMFTDQETKVETENHIKTAIIMESRYVTREEFNQFLEIQKENRADIKEILKYLRK